jgi:hypothetical protein
MIATLMVSYRFKRLAFWGAMRALSILWGRRRYILGSLAVTVSIALAYAYFSGTVYKASAVVLLDSDRCDRCNQEVRCIHDCPKAAEFDSGAMLRDFLFPYPNRAR